MEGNKPLSYLILGALTLFAFALRTYHLGFQSLWLDEAFSFYVASRPGISALIDVVAREDNHPPLYYALLGGWIPFAGSSEFALRFVSAAAGTLSIPLIARLGAQLHDERTGFLAAGLLAISPFHIWYSQEARMYALVCLLALASVLLCLKWQASARRSLAVAYVLVSVSMLLAHYYGFFILLSENLAFLMVLSRPGTVLPVVGADVPVGPSEPFGERGGPKAASCHQDAAPEPSASLRAAGIIRTGKVGFRTWVLAQAAIALLYSPWLIGMALQFRRAPQDYQSTIGLLDVAQNLSVTFSVGDIPVPLRVLGEDVPGLTISLEPAHWVFLGIMIVGSILPLWFPSRTSFPRAWWSGTTSPLVARILHQGWPRGTAVALLYLLSAPVFAYLISVALSMDLRTERRIYYIVILPAYILIVARSIAGLAQFTRILGVVAAIFLVSASLASITAQFTARAKEDFRSIVSYVAEREAAGDVIVLNAEHIHPAFSYYYGGKQAWHRAEIGDEARTVAFLERITAGADGAWLVLSRDELADPEGHVKRWFDDKGLTLDERWFLGGRVIYYSLESRPNFRAPHVPSPLEAIFAGKIALLGHELPTDVSSGSQAKIKLFWQSLEQVSDDYRVVTYLQDGTGRVWSQTDRVPLVPPYATSRWKTGEYLRDGHYLPVPLGTPPGPYDVKVRVYSPMSGATLKPDGRADELVTLGKLIVRTATPRDIARAVSKLPPATRRDLNDDLAVAQWEMSRQEVLAGERIDISLLWQARRRPNTTYEVIFEVVAATNRVVQELRSSISDSTYPTDRWDAGEVVMDRQTLPLASGLTAGWYGVRMRLAKAGDIPSSTTVHLGTIFVRVPERSFTSPEPQHRYEIDLGGEITFLGYDISNADLAAGEKLRLSTYWRAQRDIRESYKVFIHLLGPANTVIAQQDDLPLKGTRPTTGWAPGEVVRDDHELLVPAEAPPGEYRLEVGFYDPGSGKRLAVLDSGPKASENAILFGELVMIKPRR